MTEKHEVSESEYKRQCARAVIDWGTELSRRLSVDDAWRMLLAGTIAVMQAELTPEEIAETLRQAADHIEAGHIDKTIQ